MSEKTISFEELRLLCESLEDDLSDAILIIDRHADCIEEMEAKLEKAVMALQKIATVTKDGTGHNLAPVVRLAQRIEGISRATIAELKGEQP